MIVVDDGGWWMVYDDGVWLDGERILDWTLS
jgi:hypothetical protein